MSANTTDLVMHAFKCKYHDHQSLKHGPTLRSYVGRNLCNITCCVCGNVYTVLWTDERPQCYMVSDMKQGKRKPRRTKKDRPLWRGIE